MNSSRFDVLLSGKVPFTFADLGQVVAMADNLNRHPPEKKVIARGVVLYGL